MASRNLSKGLRTKQTDLALKKPGGGLEPWRLSQFAGRVLQHDVEKDQLLKEEDFD